MPVVLFRCPRTGLKVQGFVADDPSDVAGDTFVQVQCHACGSTHSVNPEADSTQPDDAAKQGVSAPRCH